MAGLFDREEGRRARIARLLCRVCVEIATQERRRDRQSRDRSAYDASTESPLRQVKAHRIMSPTNLVASMGQPRSTSSMATLPPAATSAFTSVAGLCD